MSELRSALKQYFGYDAFRGEQESIIQTVMDGNNCFVIMPTGGGKSLCYQLPALISEGTAIIISPLIALMKDQVDAIRGHYGKDSVAHYLNSTLNKSQLNEVAEDLKSGETKLLYLAPESLSKESNQELLKSINISFLAVDEAHCISEWGHDFRPVYRKIRGMIDNVSSDIPLMALTATATPKVQSDIVKNLGIEDAPLFKSSFNRDNLFYEIRPKSNPEEAQKSIVQFVKSKPNQSGIVYVLSRKSTEEISEFLRMNGVAAKAYHAGMDTKTRAKVQEEFLMDDVHVIVATIAFGMGIDKPDVRYVIHYDIPKSLENYYQETGRAGRDGLEGKCIAYFSHKDVLRFEKFLKDKPLAEREMQGQLLEEVVAFSESGACRRKEVLRYFGESFDEKNCSKMCDNCRNPRARQEAKDQLAIALQAVEVLKEKLTLKPLVDFIIGNHTSELIDFGLELKSEFGLGKDQDESYWHSLVRRAITEGYLRKEVEEYGVLKLTAEGRAFLKKPVSYMLVLNRDFVSENNEEIYTKAKNSVALDEVLFDELLSLRKSEAKKKGVQPWVIFQEASLKDMATHYPISEEDMLNISGVSQGKAKRYAAAFIHLIKDYVEANQITRPTELVIKQKADKSKNKVAIIQGIDRKLPFDDIASSVKMDVPELLQEMNVIVDSGTRLNIDYFLEEIVDEEVLEDIFEYFGEADSDSPELAFDELKEEDITLEEIQVARIKYMTVHAN